MGSRVSEIVYVGAPLLPIPSLSWEHIGKNCRFHILVSLWNSSSDMAYCSLRYSFLSTWFRKTFPYKGPMRLALYLCHEIFFVIDQCTQSISKAKTSTLLIFYGKNLGYGSPLYHPTHHTELNPTELVFRVLFY